MTIGDKVLFIFDVDGTLADAYTAIHRTLNAALRARGYRSVGYQRVKRSVGRGTRSFLYSFFPPAEVPAAIRVFRSYHKRMLMRYARPRTGAVALLKQLKKEGKLVAVASNRPRYSADLILTKTGVRPYIDFVLCADEIGSLKPRPRILRVIMRHFKVRPRDTLYIGDMDIDMETAQRAGVEAVFITGGSTSYRRVSGYKKRVIHSLKELRALLASRREERPGRSRRDV